MNTCGATMLVMTTLILGPLGCGAGALSMPSGGDDTGDGADDDEGSGQASGHGSGDGDGDTEPAGCIEAGQLARALAIVDSEAEQVHVFEAGGGELTLPAALPDGVDAHAMLIAASSGGLIAIASSYANYYPPSEGSVLRLYDRYTGALHWAREFDHRVGPIFVDAQGRVVASTGWSVEPKPAGIVVVEGQATELPSFAPVGPIGASGWMPGWIMNGAQETTGSGFYNPGTDQLVVVTSGNVPPGWRVNGETIEYIDNLSPVPRFVIAGPQGQTAIELGPFAGLGAPIHVSGEAGDYRLLSAHAGGSEGPPQLLRLHVPSGELLAIGLDPPAGLEPFDCYLPITRIDTQGRVLVELRDGGAAGIHAWDADLDTWITLGLPMTNVEDVAIGRSWGRIHEIHASGLNQTYCPPAEWSTPPTSALDGSSIQLVRLDPPLSVVVDANGYGAVTVDAQEQCASWPVEGGRRIYDLHDHDELELGIASQLLWLD
jgi:hypothetical protein